MNKTLYATGPFGEYYRIEISDNLLRDAVTIKEVLQKKEECRQIAEGITDVGLDGMLVAFGVGGDYGYSVGSTFIEPTIPFGPVSTSSIEEGVATGVDQVSAKVAEGSWEQTKYYYRTSIEGEAYTLVGSDGDVPESVDGLFLYIGQEYIVVKLKWIDGTVKLSATPSNLGIEDDGRYACLTDHPDTWFSPFFRHEATDETVAPEDRPAWRAVREE